MITQYRIANRPKKAANSPVKELLRSAYTFYHKEEFNDKIELEMTQNRFASKREKEQWKRDLAIYNEFNELTADPEASKTEVTRHLMEKYGLYSEASIWHIRKRVEKKLKEAQP